MNRPTSFSSWLLAAFAVETLSSTWCLKIHGWTPLFAILYLLSGLAFACLLLRLPELRLPALRIPAIRTPAPGSPAPRAPAPRAPAPRIPALPAPAPGKNPLRNPAIQRHAVLIGLIALVLYSWSLIWFDEFPIDITNADMLPIIKVMCERFLAGQHSHVYDPIPTIWHGVQPIYLPAMWLPYVLPVALGIDMRWIAVAGVLFAFSTFIVLYKPSASPHQTSASPHQPSAPSNTPSASRQNFLLGVLAFLLFWWIVADNTPGIISVSEEGVVIGYYTLLVLALVSGKPWLTGIAISLCMLSRYALVGWIPAFVLWLLLGKKTRQLSIISLTGILCFFALLLIPVGWVIFNRLAHLPGNYISFAGRVWKDAPDVFSTAPGLAWFFGRNGTAVLHGLLIFFTFTLPIAFTVAAVRKQRSNIPVAGLKLALVVFYCFIDVPYLYLFYTSSLVSLIILALALRDAETVPAA